MRLCRCGVKLRPRLREFSTVGVRNEHLSPSGPFSGCQNRKTPERIGNYSYPRRHYRVPLPYLLWELQRPHRRRRRYRCRGGIIRDVRVPEPGNIAGVHVRDERWRSLGGVGPPFIKAGGRILYAFVHADFLGAAASIQVRQRLWAPRGGLRDLALPQTQPLAGRRLSLFMPPVMSTAAGGEAIFWHPEVIAFNAPPRERRRPRSLRRRHRTGRRR
jgi:hypothetical protein